MESVINVKCDLLFCRDVALTYRGAVHFGHLHVTLNLLELQAQVLTPDSHERTALPGTPERGDLLKIEFYILDEYLVFLSKHCATEKKGRKMGETAAVKRS